VGSRLNIPATFRSNIPPTIQVSQLQQQVITIPNNICTAQLLNILHGWAGEAQIKQAMDADLLMAIL